MQGTILTHSREVNNTAPPMVEVRRCCHASQVNMNHGLGLVFASRPEIESIANMTAASARSKFLMVVASSVVAGRAKH